MDRRYGQPAVGGHGLAESSGRRRISGGVGKDNVDSDDGRSGFGCQADGPGYFPAVAVRCVDDQETVVFNRTVVPLGSIEDVCDGDVAERFVDRVECRYAGEHRAYDRKEAYRNYA